jgi:hypothetical protein
MPQPVLVWVTADVFWIVQQLHFAKVFSTEFYYFNKVAIVSIFELALKNRPFVSRKVS